MDEKSGQQPEVNFEFDDNLFGIGGVNDTSESNSAIEPGDTISTTDDITEFQRLRAATQADTVLNAESACQLFDRIVNWQRTTKSNPVLANLLFENLHDRASEKHFDGTKEQQKEFLEKLSEQLSDDN